MAIGFFFVKDGIVIIEPLGTEHMLADGLMKCDGAVRGDWYYCRGALEI